jgi:cobalt-zinc-cadmium efflux system membrane fusion protein
MSTRRLPQRFAVLALAACTAKPEAGAGGVEAKPAAIAISPGLLEESRVRVIRAERRAPRDLLLASGEIVTEPDGAAEVTAAVTARIVSISVRSGDHVKKGDPLAVLEAGEVARVASDLERARARVRSAERVQAQEEALSARGATSARELSEARSALEQAAAEERAATELLRSYGARGDRRVVLRAPLSGTIVRVTGVIGAPVDPMTPLFRVVDTSRLVARAEVPESDADLVPAGTRATVASLSKATSCAATVESHAPLVNASTRTVPFVVRLGPACGEFHEGAFVDVAIERASTGDKPRIGLPRDALTRVNDVPVVFVQAEKPGSFVARPVRGVTFLGPLVFIEDGVTEGELVVDRGVILLKGELLRAELE